VPNTTAALTVSPTVSTPIVDPWVAGGVLVAAGLLGGAYVGFRRHRRLGTEA
jgi:hypothetical protein